jgi:arylsulfatase
MIRLLNNPNADWADRHLFIHKGRWEKGEDPNLSKFTECAVRTARWRFVNNRVLYDISNDPYEKKDVSGQYPEVVAQLRRVYDAWWEETLPLMVNEDRPNTKEQPQWVRYEQQKRDRGIPDWNEPDI